MRIFVLILKIMVFLAFVAAVAYITYIKKWPWWVGGSIIAIAVALYVFYLIVRRIIIRKKEKSFIKNVAKKITKKPSIEEIEKEWKEYFNILRKSGKNVYDLPWVMIIGESGSGKTSLIKYSGLSLPITPVSRANEISSTKFCDWWFFEEAVVLDTAGRYSVAEDVEIDEKEWKELLTLLSETREKEPLNSIVCVISVDNLFDDEKIKIEAENLRARVNDVMRILGVRIPMFLMITKMDRVGGFVKLFNEYGKHFNEVMGYAKENSENHIQLLQNGKKQFLDRLEKLIINLKEPDFKQTAFLEEFGYLFERLEYFAEIMFSESTYLETIDFSGYYFSSALQQKCEYLFFKKFNLKTEENFDTRVPVFIKDFFKEILPAKRGAYEIIRKYLSKRFRYKKIVFYSVLLFLLGIAGLISFSFYKEENLIKNINTDIQLKKTEDLSTQILKLNDFKLSIEEYEYNKNRLTFTLYPFSYQAGKKLKEKYVNLFENSLLNKIKDNLAQNINNFEKVNDYGVINDYVGFLVDTILSLKQKMNSENVVFSKYFAGFVKNFLIVEENLPAEVAEMFADEYLTYLKWNDNYVKLNEDLDFFQTQLETIINKKPSLKWLTDQSVSLLPDITLSDFWDVSYGKGPHIKGAFTQQGWKNMQISINQLLRSVKNVEDFKNKLKKFDIWYKNEFVNEWFNFAQHFDINRYVIKNSALLVLVDVDMKTKDNPYFKFLKKAAYEFKQFNINNSMSRLLYLYAKISSIAQSINSKNSLIKKLENEKEKLIDEIKKNINQNVSNLNIKRAVFYNGYIKALSSIDALSDPKTGFYLIKAYFSPDIKNSKLMRLYMSYQKFKNSMPDQDNEIFWNLIKGPLNFVFDASVYDGARILNELWNEQVLSNLTDYSIDEMFSQNGYVRKFLNNEIGVFLQKTGYGYQPKTINGVKIPFTREFLNFLNYLQIKYASKKSVYNVKITTMPIEINEEALVKPYESKIVLECKDKNYVLENFNYKISKIFKYTNGCQKTSVFIYFSNMILKKDYKNFAEFLKSFKGNSLILTDKDFNKNLSAYKIKWIKLKYSISDDGLLEYMKKIKIPRKICY